MATNKPAVDVLILTILDEEYQAIVAELSRFGQGERHFGNNHYAWSHYNLARNQGVYRVVVGTAGTACNDFMQAAAANGLAEFAPAVLLVVGIGGGLRKGDDPMCAGDIVLSNAVWSIDRGKIGSTGLQARPLGMLTGGGLLASTQALKAHNRAWCQGLLNADGVEPRIIVGGVAASNQVQGNDDHEIIRAIRTATGDMVRAVEMESWGAAISCESYCAASQKNVLFGTIRGLSDIVSGQSGVENSKQRDHWKQKAAVHAARLAIELLVHHWPYPPRNVNIQLMAQSKPSSPSHQGLGALQMWQKKLAFLQVEQAKATDATQRFKIAEDILEAEEKIREFGGHV